jgi:hypothetical protein
VHQLQGHHAHGGAGSSSGMHEVPSSEVACLHARQLQNSRTCSTEVRSENSAVPELWEQVPDYMLTHLMGSMARRLRDVVARQGRYTGR